MIPLKDKEKIWNGKINQDLFFRAQGNRHQCALGKGKSSPYPIRGPESTKNGQSKAARVLGKFY